MPFSLRHKKVTVIGLARSGVAVANTVGRLGGIPKISEFKPLKDIESQLEGLDEGVAIEHGGHTREFIEDSAYVVLSPGVRQDIPPVQWAKAKGIEVMGEIEFAYRLCPC